MARTQEKDKEKDKIEISQYILKKFQEKQKSPELNMKDLCLRFTLKNPKFWLNKAA